MQAGAGPQREVLARRMAHPSCPLSWQVQCSTPWASTQERSAAAAEAGIPTAAAAGARELPLQLMRPLHTAVHASEVAFCCSAAEFLREPPLRSTAPSMQRPLSSSPAQSRKELFAQVADYRSHIRACLKPDRHLTKAGQYPSGGHYQPDSYSLCLLGC